MSYELVFVLALVLVTVGLFVSEKYPVDVVALIALGILLVAGILPPEEALSGFSNEAVITIGAMFVLSAGLNRSGVLEYFGRAFRMAAQRNVWRATLGLMVAVGVTSAFINNTAVVAILLPVVVAVSRDLDLSASKLLMPVSFASMFGGVCTLIGTSTNLLVSSIADDHGLEPFGMFEFSTLGLVFFVVGVVYMMTAGRRLIPERRKPEQLAQSWRMEEYLTELVLSPDSDSVGYTIADAPLTRDLDLDVVKIRRPGRGPLPTMTDTVLEADDALVVRCHVGQLRRLLQKEGVIIEPRAKWKEEDLEPREMVLVEAVVAPNSMLEGETVRSSDFRDRLGGTVIAIRHRGELKREDLNDVKLSAGDALLVETTRERLPQFRASEAFVLVSDQPIHEFRPSRAVPALVILALVVGTAAFGLVPIVTSATAGAIAMILTGCLTPEEAYRAVDWKIIFLLAGVLSLGAALEGTGGAELLSSLLSPVGTAYGPIALISAVYLATTVLTNMMSNNATAVLVAPIAIATADAIGADARPFLMAVTFAASASFMTPVGYQTNTMIYGPGQYRFGDFVRVGGPLNVIFWIVATVLIPVFWPV